MMPLADTLLHEISPGSSPVASRLGVARTSRPTRIASLANVSARLATGATPATEVACSASQAPVQASAGLLKSLARKDHLTRGRIVGIHGDRQVRFY